MKLKIDFGELERLGKIMMPDNDFQLSGPGYGGVLDTDLGEGGVDVEISDLDEDTPLLSFKGRQVLLYIKDHSRKFDAAMANGRDGNKFHVAQCKVLDKMRASNRFQRYVATNRLDGKFLIEETGRYGGSPRTGEAALAVCQLCLKRLNYLNTLKQGNWGQLSKDFSIKDFFSHYSTCFTHMPKTLSDAASVGYTANWSEVSKLVREAAGYKCDQCKVDLSTARLLCDVHHRNGVKSDNKPANLQVLCRDCHRKQPFHEGVFLPERDMKIIQNLRAVQGLLDVKRWNNDAYALSDTSIHGDLALLQENGFPPPVIGYDVVGQNGAVIANLEAAWPSRKTGISLVKMTVPGWKIYPVGQICAEAG